MHAGIEVGFRVQLGACRGVRVLGPLALEPIREEYLGGTRCQRNAVHLFKEVGHDLANLRFRLQRPGSGFVLVGDALGILADVDSRRTLPTATIDVRED